MESFTTFFRASGRSPPDDSGNAKTGRTLGLFENSPWNPGTRMVMRRIPFDRDAIPLSYIEARHGVRAAGFQVFGTRFLFYMRKALAACGKNPSAPLTNVRGSVDSSRYRTATVREPVLPRAVVTRDAQINGRIDEIDRRASCRHGSDRRFYERWQR
jgi:hypothetical protein